MHCKEVDGKSEAHIGVSGLPIVGRFIRQIFTGRAGSHFSEFHVHQEMQSVPDRIYISNGFQSVEIPFKVVDANTGETENRE